MKKKLKSIGRFLGRLAIATTVIVFMIFVRLAYGPTPVGMLGDAIVEPLQQAFPDQVFSYDGAYLEWSWEQVGFQFSLENTEISNLDGTPLADFTRLAVTFDGAKLLFGTFIPTRVDIFGAEIHLVWDSASFGSQIEKALLDPEEELPDPEDLEKPPVIRFMEAMLEGEGPESPLKNLEEVRILNATITLTEKNLGVVWEMPGGDLVLSRGDNGLALNAKLDLMTLNEEVALTIYSEETGDGLTKTEISMEGLNIAHLAEEVALGELFKTIDMPLFGTLSVWQNQKGGINLLGFDVGGGPGTIYYERFNAKSAKFDDVVFKGTLNPAENLISLESLRLVVDGDVIEGDGFIEFTEQDKAPALRMVLTSPLLKVTSFLQLWPTVKKSGGRDWIAANIENGVLANVRAELAFKPETWGLKPLPNEAMHITLDMVGGDIHFLRPMPPMENVKGRMLLEGNEVHAFVTEASVDGMLIKDLTFDIEDLTKTKAQMGHATLTLSGDIQRLMRIVDQDPLNVFIKQGLDPADYFGQAELEVRLHVPLYADAPPEATEYTIEGTITEAAVPSLMAGGGLTEGEMSMTITPTGLVSQGTALLKGVPFDFYWTQGFEAENETDYTTRVELSGFMEDHHLHTFGLPEDLTMEGTARIYMSLRGRDGDLKFGQGTADFFDAKVDADKMDWHKAAYRRAEASFDLEWTASEFFVKNAKIESRELTFNGVFVFDKLSGLMKRADIPVFVTPINDLTATARQREDGVLDVMVQARFFNANPFLETMFEDSTGVSFAPDMRLVLIAETAYGMNEVIYQNLSIEADKRSEFWLDANIIGGLDEGGAFQISLVNDETGRHLTMESDNGGRLALGTDLFRNATGGRLTLTADMNVYDENLFAQGTITATDFKMVKSSILIQALAEEEKSGLDEMIREEGLNFSELVIPFRLEDGIFDISDAHARGNAMGFTLEGEIDQEFYRMNLNGTVVPAYGLNTFISRIPIIGTIIAGGTGEGIFALNFRITGTRDEPNVDFKELSAVAPGILRKILGSQKKGKLEPVPSLREEDLVDAVEVADEGVETAAEEVLAKTPTDVGGELLEEIPPEIIEERPLVEEEDGQAVDEGKGTT
ncbi:MAG: AsmA-like C-terminal domain-containing protein [Sphingomonadales bacterium]